ncbi:8-oxoguanine DNA glycosylase OGG fold protein [Lentzea sp. NPDC055074]
MTDLSTLTLPAWETPDQCPVEINPGWWHDEISRRGLPGTPPSERLLTRDDVRGAGDVFTLLWWSLAWGAGLRLRLNARRLDSIARDLPRCEELLTKAADLSRHDPFAAYSLLRPGHSNAIRYLGPAFFTKFLYFAGRGAPGHPCLILDSRVATVLRERCGWDSLHRTGPWPAETYERYCGLLARWAQESGRAADTIEFMLFYSFSVDRN